MPPPPPLCSTMWEGEISLHTGTRTSTITQFSHTRGDSDGWNYCSCVAPNGLLKWLIKGKQLLCRRTDGASPPTEAGTQASEENTRGVWLSNLTLLLLKLALIILMKVNVNLAIKISLWRDKFLWLLITFTCFDFSLVVIKRQLMSGNWLSWRGGEKCKMELNWWNWK